MLSISAVIPCYNAADYIAEALDSVLKQTRPVSRIIVVDDGSTDDSVSIVDGYRSRGYPIECLRTQSNGGPSRARNLAIRVVEEPLIAFLDADDRWEPNHCAELAPLLEERSEAVLAYGRDMHWLEDRVTSALSGFASREVTPMSLLYDNLVIQSGALVRREAILAAGLYREEMRYAEDYDLWLRLVLRGPFLTKGAITFQKRAHKNQASNHAVKMWEGAWAARRRAYERLLMGDAEQSRLDAICAAAFRRDLNWAWQSRDRRIVGALLEIGLKSNIHGLLPVHKAWRRRLLYYWPFWRTAAAVWDAAPDPLRVWLRARRESRALSRAV